MGKTSAAIILAGIFNGEIISADSRQIYRYMNIGTAKPTPGQLDEIPHHLIDFINPDQNFDAGQFADMAHEIILKLIRKNRLPFVVGGTGLYIRALLNGLIEDDFSNPSFREKLRQEADVHGNETLYQRLKSVDPVTADRVHPNDIYRIIRALEIFEFSGTPISELHRGHHFKDTRYDVLKIGLHLEREVLYKRIDQRVDMMISEGLIDEVRKILKRGYATDLKSMKAIGYSHLIEHFKGNCTLEESISKLKRDTRRYSKRQMTWFRADPEITWLKPYETGTMIHLVNSFLKKTS